MVAVAIAFVVSSTQSLFAQDSLPSWNDTSPKQVKFEFLDGKPVLLKTMEHLFVDDKEGKPVGIHQFIG
jgi:hypothetical protein